MSDIYDHRLWCSLCQAEHEPCEYHANGIEYWFFTDKELAELMEEDEQP